MDTQTYGEQALGNFILMFVFIKLQAVPDGTAFLCITLFGELILFLDDGKPYSSFSDTGRSALL